MNDRLKLRAYVKANEEMEEVDSICFDEEMNYDAQVVVGGVGRMFDEVELMQCTGLKDKNGTLIYEGDIVYKKGSLNWKKEKINSQVVWIESLAAFGLSDENGLHQMTRNLENIEVKGNICETPELLGSEAKVDK